MGALFGVVTLACSVSAMVGTVIAKTSLPEKLKPSEGKAVALCLILAIVIVGIATQPGKATQEKKALGDTRKTRIVPAQSNTSPYTIVHSVVTGGGEIISVVVRPGIPDSDLMTVATELHKLHPRSNISFYDKMDVVRIKHWWKCLAELQKKIDDPSCPDFDQWISDHEVGSLSSVFDNPKHIGQPKWVLDGKHLRIIGYLGIDDGPVEKPVPKPASQRPQIGETAKLQAGQVKIIEMALTTYDYGEFTKCFDGPGGINCNARLLDSRKIFQVTSGTKVQVLAFRDNPYHASLLTGRLIQVRILEGAFRGQTMWTLENRVVR